MNLELMLNMLKIRPKHNTNVLKKQKILVVEEQQELVQDEAAANRHEFERLELGRQLPLKGAAGERQGGRKPEGDGKSSC
jgi:hypothetical protein